MRSSPSVRLALGVGFLCGCAANTQSSRAAPQSEPDCSFHSATSCWTMAARFPPNRAESEDTLPDKLLRPRPAILASALDSTGRVASSRPRSPEDP
jgi:hypothetical protein